jgi:hypothetical protein
MAEDEEEERQGPRPANDHGSPNGMSLDPRILRIACSTPKEDCKVRDSFPAFVHGAESLRDNTLIVAKSESPYERRVERHPLPARMQATAEDKQTAEDRPTRDYLETTRAFWQPYAERELTREDAREMARNLIGFFTVLREWTRRERERARCRVVETASSTPRRKRGRPRTRAATKDKMQS